jgi:hypothetical protein
MFVRHILLLGLLLLGLALAAPASAAPIDDRDRATPSSNRNEATEAGNPLSKIPLSALTATRDRPLFSLSRRPPTAAIEANAEPAQAPAAAAPPERPAVKLIGTILSPATSVVLLAATPRYARGTDCAEFAAAWRRLASPARDGFAAARRPCRPPGETSGGGGEPHLEDELIGAIRELARMRASGASWRVWRPARRFDYVEFLRRHSIRNEAEFRTG